MKKFTFPFVCLLVMLFLSGLFTKAFSQTYDRSNFDYWLNKMEDKDQNYHQLVQEFDNYWEGKDKTNTKGTGYKQFKRWQYSREGMCGPDGKLLPARYFANEIKNFMQSYGDKGIVGNWEFIGPEIVPIHPTSQKKTGIGRLTTVCFHPTDPNILYVGSHTGGIWKTTTGGNNWENLNTDNIPGIGVSAILVHPDNPNIIFIGTGDRDNSIVPGQGIWKTTDGGNTWNQVASDMDDILVSEIFIQPDNHNIFLAAASDGIYLSIDGGSTWNKTTGIDVNVKDMTYKPGDPSIVYATGNGKFFRSDTWGVVWTEVTTGLDEAGRCIIGVTPAQPNLVYLFATKDNTFDGFYISTNSGVSFPTKKTSSEFDGSGQGWFNIALAVDPTDEDIIFAGMQAAYKSINGGDNWTKLDQSGNTHADQHDFKFSPFTNNLYVANDGGVYYSDNVGESFITISDDLRITQVTRLAVSETDPDTFVAGLQDNGTIAPYNGQYHRITGADGMHCEVDYTDDQYMYVSTQNDHIQRSTEGAQYSGLLTNISSDITEPSGWFRPFILDQDDPNTIFAGFLNVWISNNVKENDANNIIWQNISDGDFSDDFKVAVMEQSMADGNIIYISKGDGARCYRCDNAHAPFPHWVEINKPYGDALSSFETHETDPDIVYATVERWVYKSEDRGETWDSINGNLPNIVMKTILYHKGSNEGLYVGTGAGVYYKDATMDEWVPFKSGLPLVPVWDMKIIYSTNPDRLVVGSYGRGVWKTDAMPTMNPDLAFTNTSVSVVNTEIDLDIVAINNSDYGDAGPYHIGYYVSDNNIIGPGDFLLGEDSVILHYPGIIIADNIIVDVADVTPEIPAGTYYIGAYIDNRHEVNESDETNNWITCNQQVTLTVSPAPLNVDATDGTYGDKIVVSWDPPPGSTDYHYKVYRNTTNNPGTATPISPDPWNTNTTYWDETATDGIIYYYWIQASDTYLGFRAGALSDSDNGYQYLSPPTNVDASYGIYDDKIVITWDPPEGAIYYKVWRNTSTNVSTATPLSTNWTPNNEFTDWTATMLTTYFYWVKSAMSSSGNRESPNYSDYDAGLVALMGAPEADATNGLYNDRIEITWNTIPGASHYMVYKNTVDDPNTATAMGGVWQTTTNRTDYSVNGGAYYYYWIKAATSQWGANATEFGEGDSGWRSFVPPTITASDGTNTDCIELSWTAVTGANYYMVYRNVNPITSSAIAVTEWIDQLSYNDLTAAAPGDYFYWVKVSKYGSGSFESEFSSYDIGWRKLYAPDVEATKGAYANKIKVTWDPVPGANSYRVIRFTPSTGIYETLSDWSSTLNYHYDDYDVEYGNYWTWLYYYVDAAYNNYGYKPGDQGWDYGYPGECGNLTDDPNYRSVNFHGTTLEITQRVINNGSFPIQNPSEVGYVLEETPPEGGWNYLLGTADIPSLAVGAYYDVSFIVDLDAIPDGSVPYGTWTVASYMPFGSANCQSNHHDDYLIWESIPFVYNDALHGTYTIGGTNPDYPSLSSATTDLINKGISDQVTFNVRQGTYYEQISIPAINGSGHDRTITFQTEPGKSDNAELNFSSNEGNYTIKFDGPSYITIKNLKLTSPGFTDNQSTYGRVISFSNNSHHISLLNNKISGTSDDSYISEDNVVIYCENSFCNDILIKDNEILNGSWGIYFHGVGSGTDLSTGSEISGNSIHDFMYTGISLKYHQTPQIIGNTIQFFISPVAQCFGIELANIEEGFTIDKNHVIMEPSDNVVYGIYLYDCAGSAVNRGLVSNNFVAMASNAHPLYGITVFMGSYTDIYYNSVNITGTNYQDNFCISLDCADDPATYDNNVLNNIFSNQAGGYSILIGDNAIIHNYVVSSDYNDLYKTGSFIGLYGSSNQISDLSAWQAGSGFDSNSVSTDPQFLSSTDLHVSSPALNDAAVPVSSVTEDIDGEVRHPLYPDIGADEFMPPPPEYDIYVNDIISPVTGEGLTYQETVNIDIYNVGSENVSNFPVSYSINGGTPVTEIITGTLNSFDVMNYSFTTKADLSVVGTYEIIAYTSLANDEVPGNDSFTIYVEHLPPSYCIPVYTEECFYYGYSIEDFYLNTIQHQWSWCSEMSYGNFTGISTDLEQGLSYTMEITTGMEGMYVSLWIDLDDNSVFDIYERFVTDLYCEYSYTIYSATVNVPVSANPGLHRMRVRAVYDETNIDPCDEYEYGEVHDYSVNIVTGGGLSVDLGPDFNACYGIPAILDANVSGGTTPYNYLWNTGETSPSILVSPGQDTIYSVLVSDAIGYSATDEVEAYVSLNPETTASSNSPVCEGSDIIFSGTGNYFGEAINFCTYNCDLPSYCESGAIDIFGSNVEEVIFGDINNNTIEICEGYSDFTNIKTKVSLNDSMNLHVVLNSCDFSMFFKAGKAFIDWNRDGNFEDINELVGIFNFSENEGYYDTTVIVPANAVLGNTLLRIVCRGDTDNLDSIQACGTFWEGETEDYTVEIIETLDNYIDTYSWSGPDSYFSIEQNPVIFSSIPSNAGTYTLTVVDGNGCIASDNTDVIVEINPSAYAGPDDMICESESYTLNGQASNFSSLLWSSSGTGAFDNNSILDPVYMPSAVDINNGEVELFLLAYANSPCFDNAISSMFLTIQKEPTAYAGEPGFICESESYFLLDATASNYSSLLWETSGSGYFDDLNALNPTYFPGSGETGFVELSLTAYGNSPCADAYSTMNLEIIAAPLAFAGNEAIICENESYLLAEATASNYEALFWETDGYGYFDDPWSLNPTYFPSPGEIGSIELSLIAYGTSPCAEAFSVLNLEIIAAPLAFAGNEAIICENESYFLAEATASNYSSLLWETTGSGSFDDPNSLNPTYFPGTGETGFIELSLTAYGNSPCADAFSVMNLEIIVAPLAFAGNEAIICENGSYFLSEATASNYSTLLWETDGYGYFDDPNILNPTYFTGTGETGFVELSLTAYGNSPCADAFSVMSLEIIVAPLAFAGNATIICENESYFLSDAIASNYSSLFWGTTGSGYFDDPNALNPTYFPGSGETGFVELSLTAYGNSPCADAFSVMSLEIIGAPLAFAGEEAIICENESYFLAYAIASNYSSLLWETNGSGYFDDQNALNPTYFPGSGETGFVELSLTAYGNSPCADAFSVMNLEIITAPLAFAGQEAIICENESYFLSDALASNYSSLLWETSGSGSFDDPNALNPTYYPGTGETGYVELSLTAFGNSPCTDAFSVMNLEIIAAPTAYAGNAAIICENASYFMAEATASNYSSLLWETNGSGYFDDSNALNPTYFPGPGETGFVELSLIAYGNAPCSVAFSVMNLEIIAAPLAFAGEEAIICENESYFLAGAIASNYSSLLWETSGSGSFDDPNTLNPTYFPGTGETGFIELSLTAYGNSPCANAYSTMNLEVIAAPLAFAGDEAIICENGSYFLANATASNYSTLLWETSGIGYFDDPNALNPTYFPGSGETGYVELSLTAFGNSPCADAYSTMNLEIIAAPLTFAGNAAIICENESYFLADATASNYSSLLWETNGSGYFDDPNTLNPTYFPGSGETGFIELSLTAYGNSPCADAYSTMSLEIIAAPLTFAGQEAIICENESYFLANATASNYSSLLWETSGSGYFDDPNALNPTYFPGSGETGFVELSLTAFGNTPCADAFSFMTLEIIATPLSFAGDDAIICENESYLLANATASNYSSLLWETNGSGYFDDPNTLNPTYFPGTGETGFVELSLTAYGNSPCYDAYSTMNLEIIAAPLAFAGNEAIICENESYFLSEAAASNYSALFWETDGFGYFDDPYTLNPTYFPGMGETGFVEHSLTAYGNAPCSDAFSVMNLEIIAAPLAFAGNEAIICENESYNISDATASNYEALFWETDGFGYFDDPYSLNPTYYPGTGETGFIELSLTAYGNSPCADAFSVMNLEIIAAPLAFAGNEAIICENESYFLVNATASNYSALFWETNGSGYFDDPYSLNPTYFPGSGETGFVELSLTAFGNTPCAEAFSVMNLEIIVAPTAYAGEDATIMEGEAYYIYDATASNYESLEWSTDGSGYFDDPNTLNPTYFPGSGETGTVVLSLNVDGFTPCSIVYSSMNLEIIGGGYPLNIGYQFVSSRIVPYSPNMLDVLANNLENIDFVRNSAGQMLRKIGPIWINSIGDWITTEGYLFRMINPDLLTIYGSAIDPQTPIGLALGYQMISYLPALPINTYDVFLDVLSNLAFVRNTAGLMFRKIGPVWINGIGDMQAGEGYLVKMNADDVLIYPETTDNLFALKTPISEHYKVFGGNPYDPVWSIYFEQGVLNIGDEIGVYDGVVLAGAGIVVSENILENSIPVFSNLYESGNYPIFKIWNKNENEEFLLTDYSYINPYGDAYMEEIFPETDGEYSMLNFSITGISDNFKHASITIYPNPSNGIFNISMERVSGDLQCKVIDLTGNEYRNFEFTGIKGFTIKQLDLKELPAGVYFVSFTSRNLSKVEKIVIN